MDKDWKLKKVIITKAYKVNPESVVEGKEMFLCIDEDRENGSHYRVRDIETLRKKLIDELTELSEEQLEYENTHHTDKHKYYAEAYNYCKKIINKRFGREE